MASKGVGGAEAGAHHERMRAMLSRFRAGAGAGRPLFGPADVGARYYWWDYGQLALYVKNNLLVRARRGRRAARRGGGAPTARARARR